MSKYRTSRLRDEDAVECVDNSTGEIIWLASAVIDKERAKHKPLNNQRNPKSNLQHGVALPTSSGRFEGSMFWIRADKEFFERMLLLDLPRNPRRVLDALMVRARFGNYVSASYAELTKLTNIGETHISAAMKVLAKHDLVVRLGRGKYMVNPMYCFMGDGDTRFSALGMYADARRKDAERRNRKEAEQ